MFSSQCLTTLKLSNNDEELRFPSVTKMCNLRVLHLKDFVMFGKVERFNKLISGCESLQHLVLINVEIDAEEGLFEIKNPKLESLVIDNVRWVNWKVDRDLSKVVACTPNRRTLSCEVDVSYIPWELPLLESASLEIGMGEKYDNVPFRDLFAYCRHWQRVFAEGTRTLLESVRRTVSHTMCVVPIVKGARDRLSDLPDPILHHIFSFIDTRYAVRSSVLSSRWRHLWKSLPHLYFNGEAHRRRNITVRLVNNVLYRNDNSDIHTLRIESVAHWHYDSIRSWILAAIARNVHELDLLNFSQ
ncbi:hypothetical protein Sjap_003599 [Stephania japonica]|uniref:F-box domain-containing protein n=1 Tax=Stephania japonica TaxID=461633 RepID=A0AAP0KRH9_9MAGN